jgi:hypothetical protein
LSDEPTPKWAVELLIRFEQLDAKISAAEERNGSHSSWAERNIKDHEVRLRSLEQFKWVLIGLSLASGGISAAIMRAM